MSHAAVGIALLIAGAVLELGGTLPFAVAGAGAWLVLIGLVFETP
jgi:hypothetical protein